MFGDNEKFLFTKLSSDKEISIPVNEYIREKEEIVITEG